MGIAILRPRRGRSRPVWRRLPQAVPLEAAAETNVVVTWVSAARPARPPSTAERGFLGAWWYTLRYWIRGGP